jgi:hypothetical protein
MLRPEVMIEVSVFQRQQKLKCPCPSLSTCATAWRNSFSVTMSYQVNLRPITEIHWGLIPDIVDEVHSSVYYIYRESTKGKYVFSIDIVSQAEEKRKKTQSLKRESCRRAGRRLREKSCGRKSCRRKRAGEKELQEKELQEKELQEKRAAGERELQGNAGNISLAQSR